MVESLIRAELLKGLEDCGCEGFRGDFRGQPDSGLVNDKVGQPMGSGHGDDRQSCGCRLKQCVWQAFMAGGQDESCGAGKIVGRMRDVSGEMDG